MHIHIAPSPNWSLSHAVDAGPHGVVALAGHASIVVLCTRTQTVLRCLGPHKCRACCVAFVPQPSSISDARASSTTTSSSSSSCQWQLIAGYEDGSVCCWDCQTGLRLHSNKAKATGAAAATPAKRSKGKPAERPLALTALLVPQWPNAPAVFGDASGRLMTWRPWNSSTQALSVLLSTNSSSSSSSSGSSGGDVKSRHGRVACLAATPSAGPGQPQLQQVVAGFEDGHVLLVDVAAGCQLAAWPAHSAAVQSVTWLRGTAEPDCSRQQQQSRQEGGTENRGSEPPQQQQQEGLITEEKQQQHDEQQQQQQQFEEQRQSKLQQGAAGTELCRPRNYVITASADKAIKLWAVPDAVNDLAVEPESAAAEPDSTDKGCAAADGQAAGDDDMVAAAPAAATAVAAAAAAENAGNAAADAAAGVDAAITSGAETIEVSGAAADVAAPVTQGVAGTGAGAGEAGSAVAGPAVALDQTAPVARAAADDEAGAGCVMASQQQQLQEQEQQQLQEQQAQEQQAQEQQQLVPKLLVAAAAVDCQGSSSGAGGGHRAWHYAAVAAVPGSLQPDGSCLVVAAGELGSLTLLQLQPGSQSCRRVRLSSPHTRTIYQLLLLPQHSKQQQQGQQMASSFKLVSSSMDRSLAVSQISMQQLPGAPAAAATAAATVAAGFNSSSSSTSDSRVPAQQDHQGRGGQAAAGSSGSTTAQAAAAAPAAPAGSRTTRSSSSSGGVGDAGQGSQKQQPGSAAVVRCAGPSGTDISVSGCKLAWLFSGLGSPVSCCSAQQSYPHMLQKPPAYSAVKVAVGCGDKTIRVLTLGLRLAGSGSSSSAPAAPGAVLSRASSSSSLQSLPSCSSSVVSCSSGTAAAAAALLAEPLQQVSSAVAGGGSTADSNTTAAAASEVRASALQPSLLLWQNIEVTVTAVAWHPTNPRLLAFGCSNGCLGLFDVCSGRSTLCSKRHGGPVTRIGWHQAWHSCQDGGYNQQQQQQHGYSQQQQQQQQQQQPSVMPAGAPVLYSLGGEGCLLCWPGFGLGVDLAAPPGSARAARSDSGASGTQLLDVGVQLQQQLSLLQAPDGASAAGGAAGAAAATAGPDAGAAADIIWTCFSWHSAGSVLAVGSAQGQLLLCQLQQQQQQLDSSRRTKSSSSSSSGGGVQVMAAAVTPAGLPLIAAVWQPAPTTAALQQTAMNAAEEAPPAAAAAETGAGWLLAAMDKQAVHLFSCCQLQEQQETGHISAAVLSLVLLGSYRAPAAGAAASTAGYWRDVAWSDTITVCAAGNDGSCQVLQVQQGPPPAADSMQHDSMQQQQHLRLELVPLHSIRCHAGAIHCLSALPGWPGVLLSGSLDQTLCSWQPLAEAGEMGAAASKPPKTQATAAAAATIVASAAASEEGATGKAAAAEEAADGAASEAAAVGAALDASTAHAAATITHDDDRMQVEAPDKDQAAAAVAAAATQRPEADSDQADDAAAVEAAPTEAAGAAEAEAAEAEAAEAEAAEAGPRSGLQQPSAAKPQSSGTSKSRSSAAGQLICNKTRSFLPDLPDFSDVLVQQQAQLDAVALAEALFPPVPAGAASVVVQGLWPASFSSDDWGLEALPAAGVMAFDAAGTDTKQQQRQSRGCSGSSSAARGVTDAFHSAVASTIVADYQVGSWLPVMTADAPELVLQQEARFRQQQQQHQQRGSASSSSSHPKLLSAGQMATLQFVSGDVAGFLRTAVSADVITPDVVTLSAAGGSAAFAAAARLAAVKLAAAGEREAAAVHLLAAGDAAAAAAALQ